MTSRIRHCLECPKCRTRYLFTKTQYANGSYVIVQREDDYEEYTLYCSCGQPAAISRWTSTDLARCTVSDGAYARGYGSAEEIIACGR